MFSFKITFSSKHYFNVAQFEFHRLILIKTINSQTNIIQTKLCFQINKYHKHENFIEVNPILITQTNKLDPNSHEKINLEQIKALNGTISIVSHIKPIILHKVRFPDTRGK